MPVEIAGFAQALARCPDFQTVEPPELEDALTEANEPLAMEYVEASADDPLIRSGSLFTHLLFVQHGTVVPWQYPYSELGAPFLIGEHEFLMGAPRWVGSYSAVTEAIVVWIPVALIDHVVRPDPAGTRADAPIGDASLGTLLLDVSGYQRHPVLSCGSSTCFQTCPRGQRSRRGKDHPNQAKGSHSSNRHVPFRCCGRAGRIGESRRDPTGR